MQNGTTGWCIAATLVLAAASHAQPLQWRTIALSGQPAPGLPGVTFENLTDARITPDAATIAFRANLIGTGVVTDTDGSIWTLDSGSSTPSLRYREGTPAPGTTAATLTGIPTVNLAPNGFIGFAAGLYEGTPASTATNIAYYIESAPGSLSLIVREPLNSFLLPNHIPLSPSRSTVWTQSGVVQTPAGPVVGTTTPVPWDPAATFRVFSQAQLGPDSEVVLRAGYGATATTASWQYALLTNSPTLATRATSGAPVPDMNATWLDIGTAPVIAPGGQIAVWGRVTPTGATTPIQGLFYSEAAALAPLVLEGDPVPGVPGATFTAFDPALSMNDDGRVAFIARFTGPGVTTNLDNSGVFIAQDGQPTRLVMRRGEAISGAPGVTLRQPTPPAHQGNVIAFIAYTSGGPAAGSPQVLIAGDHRVRPRAVISSGTSFQIPGGATQTVRAIAFSSEPAFTGRSQIADRELLVKLSFTDATHGLFAVTLPCIADFNGDGDIGTDQDIESFFACLAGNCCPTCGTSDFNADGDFGTDQDIEAFFRLLGGGC
jgi:hypothetical protein